MKKITLKMRNGFGNFVETFSFTAVLFVFQACYGDVQDFESKVQEETSQVQRDKIKVTGVVKSKTTKQPVKGIKVSFGDRKDCSVITNDKGAFFIEFYIQSMADYVDSDKKTILALFSDSDGEENGWYKGLGIVVDINYSNSAHVEVELEEAGK